MKVGYSLMIKSMKVGAMPHVKHFTVKKKKRTTESFHVLTSLFPVDEGLRGAFGSMISVNMGASSDLTSGTTNNMAMSAQRKQVFAKTAIV